MTFGATVLATLIGAFVGAFAAWLFALDLSRRAAADAYRSRLDLAVAAVVTSLEEFNGAVKAFNFAIRHGNSAITAPPPHLARHQLLSALFVARIAAGDDDGPFVAIYNHVSSTEVEPSYRSSVDHDFIGLVLVRWCRGAITTKDATSQITTGSRIS